MASSLSTRVPFHSGLSIPIYGLGTWLAKEKECYSAVLFALQNGHKLIDTAQMYNNEEEVGRALEESGIPRESLFITTKLSPEVDTRTPGAVTASLKESLKKLRTSYVDVFFVHTPKPGNVLATWKEVMECKKEGLAKVIGVSNFGPEQIQGLIDAGLETPEVNQIEYHTLWPQKETVEYHKKMGIVTMGFCPLARCKKFGEDNAILKMAKKYGVTEAQVMIAWSVATGAVTIPKSSNEGRILQNAQSLEVKLTEEDMKELEEVGREEFHASTASLSMKLPWDEVKN